MAVDDLPFPVNTKADFRGIPAGEHAFRSIRQFSIVDKVECQESQSKESLFASRLLSLRIVGGCSGPRQFPAITV
jgi:hypothetical protein